MGGAHILRVLGTRSFLATVRELHHVKNWLTVALWTSWVSALGPTRALFHKQGAATQKG